MCQHGSGGQNVVPPESAVEFYEVDSASRLIPPGAALIYADFSGLRRNENSVYIWFSPILSTIYNH